MLMSRQYNCPWLPLHARVILLCACVQYWPYHVPRGLGADKSELGEVWFSKALHHGENTGLCTLRVTSLCNSFANVFNLLYVCKFLTCDDLIIENLLDSNSRQYCYEHFMKVQANIAEVQPEEERPWKRG